MAILTPRMEREIADSPARDDELVLRYGVSRSTIRRIRREGPRQGTRREQFEDVVADGWKADCMEPDDWAHWVATNPLGIGDGQIADRPCTDCPLGFAAEMRAEGKCNGTPGWHPPAEELEEAEMGDTVTVADVQVNAPCGRCAHEPVCGIKASLVAVRGGVELAMPKPDPALTVVVGLQVDCSHFLAVKGAAGSRKGYKLNLTPEQRARRAENVRNFNARRAAAVEPVEATA